MTLPPANSVKACPKCLADTKDATCKFIIDGKYGKLMRGCRRCGGYWNEATADTPAPPRSFEAEANAEVEAILSPALTPAMRSSSSGVSPNE